MEQGEGNAKRRGLALPREEKAGDRVSHARTRPSSKRAVCTLWSGGSRRESHLTMMIVCRDDRSATIVRDKNSMSITITRYRYQLQLQSMIIVHQRRLGGARQWRIIELSRRWMIDDQN